MCEARCILGPDPALQFFVPVSTIQIEENGNYKLKLTGTIRNDGCKIYDGDGCWIIKLIGPGTAPFSRSRSLSHRQI